MEKLRSKVERSVTISDKNEEIRFTISIGLATHHEDTLDSTINQADLYLYDAKNSGRNRVVSN